MNDLTIKRYKVDGMHCISCAILIEGELEDTRLADEAACDYAKSELTLKSQKEINHNQVSQAVEKLGYKITPTE